MNTLEIPKSEIASRPGAETAPAILFVDDEPLVLSAIRRTLGDMKDQWNMVFAKDPAVAVEWMATRAFDVIVVDSKMPGASGAQVARDAQKLCPQALCILLSGELDKPMPALPDNIRYRLAKPCPQAVLKAALHDLLTKARRTRR